MNLSILKKYLLAYLPAIIWASIIFAFSSQKVIPGVEEYAPDFFMKKFAHVFVYLILYSLLQFAVNRTTQTNQTKMRLYLPIVLCCVYAISDEIHQSFVPGRTATLRDIGYDMVGVSIAFLRKYGYI